MTQEPFNNNQFVISYELLELFKWMLENEQDTLRKLIIKALYNGLNKKINCYSPSKSENQDELQQSIIDFFALLDTLLYDAISETEVKQIVERNLIPAIDNIDSSMCDK